MENIINKLRYFNKKFPRETLEEAIKMKEEITPILLADLDRIIKDPEIVTEDLDYMLHTYGMFLLAQFREKRAFKRIIELIRFSPDEVELIFGDVLTENLASILYSTFDGNLNTLQSVIENPLLNIYARGAALDVYGKLNSDGIVSKEECIEYLRELIYDNPYDEDSDLATHIEGVVIDRHIFEMIDDIQFLYDQNRVELFMFGDYDEFIDSIFDYDYDIEGVDYIDDIIKKMYWWACFEQTEEEKRKTKARMKKLEDSIEKEEKLTKQLVEKPKKIGRNDPCPCGSGKKYKKCCLRKEEVTEAGPKVNYSESAEEQKKWLKNYPKEEGNRREGDIRITDLYDKESIAIDKSVYLALHHRAIPILVKRDRHREEMIIISYLMEAFEKFLSKCEKEGISSFTAYDSKYKIHYRSQDWIEILVRLIEKHELQVKYKDVMLRINKTISSFS